MGTVNHHLSYFVYSVVKKVWRKCLRTKLSSVLFYVFPRFWENIDFQKTVSIFETMMRQHWIHVLECHWNVFDLSQLDFEKMTETWFTQKPLSQHRWLWVRPQNMFSRIIRMIPTRIFSELWLCVTDWLS